MFCEGILRAGHPASSWYAACETVKKKTHPIGCVFTYKDDPKERERYERATLPDLRQLVHTFIFLRWPSTTQYTR